MSSHQEPVGKGAAPESRDERTAKDASAETPKPNKLAVVGRYFMLAVVPILSLAALGVAVFAVTGNRSGAEQISKAAANIESLSATLTATQSELEKLKAAQALEKIAQEVERKKLDEQLAKIIQNVTPLQVKLKISPTLEEQLHQPTGASSVLPAATLNSPVAHAAPITRAAPAAARTGDKKLNPQVKIMKEMIEKYNKN